MKHLIGAIALIGILAGCSSTKVTESQNLAENDQLPRPDRVIVYDFSATASDIPPQSTLYGKVSDPAEPQSPDEIALGQKLGDSVADKLVTRINEMGLTAVRADDAAPPETGDVLVKGHFVSIDKGSEAQRVFVGFGAGEAELQTFVEGYQKTDTGLRPLGSRQLTDGGGSVPGVLVPLAVVASTGNPIGLIVGGSARVSGEATGSSTIDGAAERTADKIAEEIKVPFTKQGWI